MTTRLKSFFRGDDYALQVTVRDKETKTPIDITGWVLVSSMKLSSELPDEPELNQDGYRQVLRVVKVVEPGGEAELGKAALLFPHSQTSELVITDYQIDIQAEQSGGIITLVKAVVGVDSDVTRGIYAVDVEPETSVVSRSAATVTNDG